MANSETFEIRLTPKALATMMVARVARERRRIALAIEAIKYEPDLMRGYTDPDSIIDMIAERVRSGDGSGVDVRPMTEAGTTTEDDGLVEPMEPDPLPAMRHGDDFEDGVALVRAGHAFGRSMLPRD